MFSDLSRQGITESSGRMQSMQLLPTCQSVMARQRHEDNAHPLDAQFATQSKANCNEIEMMTNPKTKTEKRGMNADAVKTTICCRLLHPPVLFHLCIHCDSINFDSSSTNRMYSLLLIFSIKNIALYMFLFHSLPF